MGMPFVKQIKEAGVLEGVVLLGFNLAFKGRRTKVRCLRQFLPGAWRDLTLFSQP